MNGLHLLNDDTRPPGHISHIIIKSRYVIETANKINSTDAHPVHVYWKYDIARCIWKILSSIFCIKYKGPLWIFVKNIEFPMLSFFTYIEITWQYIHFNVVHILYYSLKCATMRLMQLSRQYSPWCNLKKNSMILHFVKSTIVILYIITMKPSIQLTFDHNTVIKNIESHWWWVLLRKSSDINFLLGCRVCGLLVQLMYPIFFRESSISSLIHISSILDNGSDDLFIFELQLNHVSKRGPRGPIYKQELPGISMHS